MSSGQAQDEKANKLSSQRRLLFSDAEHGHAFTRRGRVHLLSTRACFSLRGRAFTFCNPGHGRGFVRHGRALTLCNRGHLSTRERFTPTRSRSLFMP